MGIATGINAAFITLYFSVTMLVLTVASSNLGVRLVNRWLDRRVVRLTLSLLAFSLVFCLVVQGSIDSEAALADTPLAATALTIAFQAINVAALAIALHDLGRTIFVDRSIHYLGQEAADGNLELIGRKPFDGEWTMTVEANRDGYVEGTDLATLKRLLAGHPGVTEVAAAPGQHVMKGDALIRLEHAYRDANALRNTVPVGPWRSDAQGVVFRIRLLVEIAARALSPAVNDFYTGLACADRLTQALAAQGSRWVETGDAPTSADAPDIILSGQDFYNLFNDPLAAFRQAACQYPSVSIRMIDNYIRLITREHGPVSSGDMRDFLLGQARDLSEHAAAQATYEGDARDIREAFERRRRVACAQSVEAHQA